MRHAKSLYIHYVYAIYMKESDNNISLLALLEIGRSDGICCVFVHNLNGSPFVQ